MPHDKITPFDKFFTPVYQEGKFVTDQMINELKTAIKDPLLLTHVLKQYVKFQNKYRTKRRT